MAIRITAGLAASSTKVVDIDTGVEIQRIRDIQLMVKPGGIWEAKLTVLVDEVDITAKSETVKDKIDIRTMGRT